MRKKTYQVTTFDELRRRMQEAEAKAAKEAQKDSKETAKSAPKGPGQREPEIDLTLKESGQKKVINGYDCREVVMTITVREKGKTLEQGGGMEAVQSKEQLAQQKSQEDESIDPTSVRGILGGLGKKMARKKIEEGGGPKTRATVFTMNDELLKVSTNVTGTDLSIPAGFKEKK